MTISHRDLAHEFANGTTEGDGFRYGFRMFIRKDTIYSHGFHFPIAKRFKTGHLFNPETYSTSTSRHQSLVYEAIRHKPIWYAKNCEVKQLVPTQAERAERMICVLPGSRGKFDEYVGELISTIQKSIELHEEFSSNLQPMYDLLITEEAQKAMTKIKKRLGDVPEPLKTFYGKSQFLGKV